MTPLSYHPSQLSLIRLEVMPLLVQILINTFKDYITIPLYLDRCNESSNNIDHLSRRICVPNKIDVILSIFNIIARVNESKTLTKHVSCECKCKFNSRKCDSNQS